MAIKPILFNTEMVRAILDGRKTVTRRLIKHNVDAVLNSPYHMEHPEIEDKQIIIKLCRPPYQPGDILYVRETWKYYEKAAGYGEEFHIEQRLAYKADENRNDVQKYSEWYEGTWHPSIHMPKEAARIWLRVKNVRVERLQEISAESALAEGADKYIHTNGGLDENMTITSFIGIWNSTIKKSDLDSYGWDASPWVWVIEFEQCEKPECV